MLPDASGRSKNTLPSLPNRLMQEDVLRETEEQQQTKKRKKKQCTETFELFARSGATCSGFLHIEGVPIPASIKLRCGRVSWRSIPSPKDVETFGRVFDGFAVTRR